MVKSLKASLTSCSSFYHDKYKLPHTDLHREGYVILTESVVYLSEIVRFKLIENGRSHFFQISLVHF